MHRRATKAIEMPVALTLPELDWLLDEVPALHADTPLRSKLEEARLLSKSLDSRSLEVERVRGSLVSLEHMAVAFLRRQDQFYPWQKCKTSTRGPGRSLAQQVGWTVS